VTGIASEGEAHVLDAAECARLVRRRRFERERAAIQREIDRLQQRGDDDPHGELEGLLVRKYELIQAIARLG
jgi:hypothetical protein